MSNYKAQKFNSIQEMQQWFQEQNQQASQRVFFATDKPTPQPPQPANVVLSTIPAQPVNPGNNTQPDPEKLAQLQELGKKAGELQGQVNELTAAKQTAKVKTALKAAKSALTRAVKKYNALNAELMPA